MLLTLTASTPVVLSTAENIGAAAQTEQARRTPARTHVLCEEGNSLSSPPGLQEGVHCPAQPLHKSQAVPHLATGPQHVLGFPIPCGLFGLDGRREEAAFPQPHPRSVPGVLAIPLIPSPCPHGKDASAPVSVPKAPSPSLAPAASVWQHPERPKTSCPQKHRLPVELV